VGVTVSR